MAIEYDHQRISRAAPPPLTSTVPSRQPRTARVCSYTTLYSQTLLIEPAPHCKQVGSEPLCANGQGSPRDPGGVAETTGWAWLHSSPSGRRASRCHGPSLTRRRRTRQITTSGTTSPMTAARPSPKRLPRTAAAPRATPAARAAPRAARPSAASTLRAASAPWAPAATTCTACPPQRCGAPCRAARRHVPQPAGLSFRAVQRAG